ncbi:hypothetical protein L198_05502 [Cryptococcus wingfieldii CBS 7118]|uniref:Uncharacterized protein n=1 Tax=Cryptococcus wingfieldii CBS 7118 TaxID=1295528 RepID=A0A1E3IVX7_9TREE|nr:hypothetical protein L198_05502 [Cryptococcus wingfieldii CBS 7118]ODN92708.1 hypothetical protein L198_05502 [Cryptococcus wingfieldii CBS 7118]
MPFPDRRHLSPPPHLPDFPSEVIRRIIYFRLSLPPSFPSPVAAHHETAEIQPSWDCWAGAKGREVDCKLIKARKDISKTALGLLFVCKAWKPVVLEYLYASPHITDNLTLLAQAILRGDAKWSDINIHKFSLPGRYLTTLDLSHLPPEFDRYAPGPIATRQGVLSIFPLLPNVVHLKLGEKDCRRVVPLEEIGYSAFASKLQSLEGVWVDERERGGVDLVRLLRRLPSLQALSVSGPGIAVEPSDLDGAAPLSLPKLHSLKLEGIPSGFFISSLLSASLPSLTRLALTPTPLLPNDQSLPLQHSLSSQILSLSYLSPRGWPKADWGIPPGTLTIHPNLIHLAVLDQDYEALDILLRSSSAHDHPLKALTVQKWSPSTFPSPTLSLSSSPPTAPSSIFPLSPPPSPPLAGSSSPSRKSGPAFLHTILSHRSPAPKGLKTITIDGFKWLNPSLGVIAMQAGQMGEMRYQANLLSSQKGIEVRDMEGEKVPALVGASPVGMGGMGMGGMGGKGAMAIRGRRGSGTGLQGRWMMMSPPREGGLRERLQEKEGWDEDGG